MVNSKWWHTNLLAVEQSEAWADNKASVKAQVLRGQPQSDTSFN